MCVCIIDLYNSDQQQWAIFASMSVCLLVKLKEEMLYSIQTTIEFVLNTGSNSLL